MTAVAIPDFPSPPSPATVAPMECPTPRLPSPRFPLPWPLATLLIATLALSLAGCSETDSENAPPQVRTRLQRLLPPRIQDRAGWAADIQSALAALDIEPSSRNLCSVIAVIEQESSFVADPQVPGLGAISLKEIDARAQRHHIPVFAVRGALKLKSPDGQTWEARIAAARTEKQLSDLFEEMIAQVPMGSRLLARANPVHTGGPMQVSIAFAESHARRKRYPYASDGAIRHAVFSRRGGVYFGAAHLLDYDADYDRPLYRFADFNAGRFASRNAAFQNAVAIAGGTKLQLDGDLVRYRKGDDGTTTGATETAVLALAAKLDMTAAQIRADLDRGTEAGFSETALYTNVFRLADKRGGRRAPRAMLPKIDLHSPKITRHLTTEWFARRVDGRYARCMARAKRG